MWANLKPTQRRPHAADHSPTQAHRHRSLERFSYSANIPHVASPARDSKTPTQPTPQHKRRPLKSPSTPPHRTTSHARRSPRHTPHHSNPTHPPPTHPTQHPPPPQPPTNPPPPTPNPPPPHPTPRNPPPQTTPTTTKHQPHNPISYTKTTHYQ
ncbi:unnamed protein product [Nezara viridula]|uniref:Uncharacterized protein n=1 Tax=Nezara viridula TaxID=85310 RepID=A0A9P0E7R7_NEZVI|nr:unnamed protein product [Nezara viridula]